MNKTKWDEIRLAMYELGSAAPKWRTRDRISGYMSNWEGEWFYHFREGGYESIEWLDIATPDSKQRDVVRVALRDIHVPGEETDTGFRVLGYTEAGSSVDYI